MRSKKALTLIFIFILSGSTFTYFVGCKKIDLDRLAAVRTDQPENISTYSVKAHGDLIDLGENEKVIEYGFCLSLLHTPTISDKAIPPFNETTLLGTFSSNISGLAHNSTYQMRAYVIDYYGKVFYGDIVEFKTLSSGTNGYWLEQDDDGVNTDGIGLTDGGNFDVAIRYESIDLQQYNGYRISKIKFFPKEGAPTKYYVTVYEGSNPPDLMYYELVENSNINGWTEYEPVNDHFIDSSMELWVGYWVVDHPAGTYPAGVDDGPAVTGYGDMFSTDQGDTWDALSILYPSLDYNWNLQVYVTNDKGGEVKITKSKMAKRPDNNNTEINRNNHLVSEKQPKDRF